MKQPGSLLLAWQVKDKHCLVIGGGDVALSRVHHLIRAQAKITVVSGANVHPELLELHEKGELHSLLKRDYEPDDLHMYEQKDQLSLESFKDIDESHYEQIDEQVRNQVFACVCCCIDDPVLSGKVYYQCKYLRLPVNIADKPPMCDFYFGSMFNQDSLQIMISTNGKSPRLSKMIKDDIARQFSNIRLNDAVDTLGSIRANLRERKLKDNSLETIERRMEWIKKLTDFFTLRQWSQLHLTEAQVDKVVDCYPNFPPKDYEEFLKFVS
ncbi:Bifunctional dehydrogenase and ferrochelatase [Candidozyma auris]|uniref:precorrin-2 dehydrogenase n=2 Tax=Candidozyma auris TaxID=498019 RepID=A0A2H0ZGK6_CANAR|nr:hypothetical protein QG37_06871 [[Candida] auris]PIS49736.1 hypothetical protein B9J08_004763 [[Candida] auris]QWW25147.1 hypothetical protein CA7LBN_004029 [[Candida] auris]